MKGVAAKQLYILLCYSVNTNGSERTSKSDSTQTTSIWISLNTPLTLGQIHYRNAEIEPIAEWLNQPIREPLGQPIMKQITERQNAYKKPFSQSSTPSPDEDLQVAVETSCSFQ